MFKKQEYESHYRICPSKFPFNQVKKVLSSYGRIVQNNENNKKNQAEFISPEGHTTVRIIEETPPYVGGCTYLIITSLRKLRKISKSLKLLLSTTNAEHLKTDKRPLEGRLRLAIEKHFGLKTF